ncbi:MAG TPA: D-tyrosyl-tRNA(Tyr) deacylase [Firmicutes bacterium]|nr:D-tyrosyl-tRNA(Tyr) deacylase [Bacillota bacterium]
MKALLQRVSSAAVEIDGEYIAKIGKGFLVLLGVMENDTQAQADLLAEKILHLRVFEDQQGKMNLSLVQVEGKVLAVSQFTLAADCSHGRRPSFVQAARPEVARPLYEYFIEQLQIRGVHVQTGRFGADMRVSLVNDGPVTIMLDTDEWGLDRKTLLEGKKQ